jgi:hypothetical protein
MWGMRLRGMSARGLCGFALLLLTPERSTKPDTKIIVATALSIPPDLGRIITTDIVLPALHVAPSAFGRIAVCATAARIRKDPDSNPGRK